MQAYINHLLEDIHAAHRPSDYFQKPKVTSEEDDLESHFKEIDQYTQGGNEYVFSGYCRLDRESFPPVDQLSNDQLVQVTTAFVAMMNSWNLEVALPDDLPQPRRYELLMEILVRQVMIFEHGFYCFDFCTGNPDGCQLGEYCTCLKSEWYNP